MQRRRFINLAAYTAVALAIPFALGCADKAAEIESQPYLFAHLVDADTIMATGKAYRKAKPTEDDKAKLIQLLLPVNGSAPGASSDKDAIRALLDSRVKDDFKSGKTVVIKGWVLSVTEARQCALFSILNS